MLSYWAGELPSRIGSSEEKATLTTPKKSASPKRICDECPRYEIPRPLRSGNATVDCARIRQYNGLLKMVEWGLKHPDAIHTAIATLDECSKSDGSDVELTEAPTFHATYQEIKRAPKYFRWHQLNVELSSLTQARLSQIDTHDKDAINRL